MKLSELLYAIGKIAEDKGLSTPYIVGGFPRDRALNRVEEINDIDLTTGDSDIHVLFEELVKKLGNNAVYKRLPDGHSSININNLKLDFSSNFIVPGITSMLQKVRVINPTDMQKELYSRDFTCNAMLMSLDLKTIIDPTGLGMRDIKNKIIRTCLTPDLTIGYNTRRIIRIVYMSAKLDFDVDPEIIEWVRLRPELVAESTNNYLIKKINKSLQYNKARTIEMLDKMNLWKYIPPTKELIPYINNKRI